MLLYSVLNVAHAQWQTVVNGVTPSALRGGHEANGSVLYIARVKHGNGVHMGKARANSREAFIPFGGKELVLSNYEVFTGTGQWVKASANNFPANAIQGGYEADGAKLYIVRAVIDGGYHPGKARKNGDGFIPFGGVERIVKDYEVLTSNPVATITPGTYHIRSQIENKPMDVVNGHNANGNGLHLWDFHGGDAQQFTIERSNEAGYYYIKTKWGRVLDIKDWSGASGATLYTWDFHGGDNQKWRFIDRGNGFYNIESKYRTYIDVKGGGNAIGTPIHMSDYSMWGNNIAQLWKLEALINLRGTTINRSTWTSTLNSIFQSSAVRLNNFTPNQNQYRTNERQFYKPDDSYIRLRFSGTDYTLPIPIDIAEVGPNNMCKMYINDWNTNQITADAEEGRLKITLRFEDNGVEVESNCYNNFFCFQGCPKFDYFNSTITIWLNLIAQNGRLSYNANAVFSATANESGPCVNNLFAFLCPSDRAGMVKSIIETKLNEHLNSPSIKIPFDAALNSFIPAGTTINSVRVNSSGNIVIR
jgi:hypothetical protein